jgi:arylsulfatase A-like enzyme
MKSRCVSPGLVGFLSVLAFVASTISCQSAEARKINILHLHADDHRADGLHALGNELLRTPNLDTLVGRGMTFTHCYTMGSMIGAVCLPSRTMLLTGRSWLRVPGRMDPQMKPIDASQFLPRVLGAAGYETFHVGKGGNEFKAGIESFDTNVVMDDHGPDQRRGSSERHADVAIKFLKERKNDRPFFIYFAPPVPHDPRVAAPEFHKSYDAAQVPLPAAFMSQHPWDNGEMTVRDEQLAPWPRTPENTKQQLADYYACITGLDHHIGRIFDQLKASGEWDNTVIIFTGDNGLSMGEHGLFGKQNLYEFGGMHVPCVMAGPGITNGRSDALIYLMDLFPTFCDLAGAKVPAKVEGRSLAAILHGEPSKVRDVLYTGYRDCQRSIRDDRWKLIRYPLVDKTQLFDLRSDPHELTNLADRPDQEERIADLTARLQKEMSSSSDHAPLKVANPQPAVWRPPAGGSIPKTKRTRLKAAEK